MISWWNLFWIVPLAGSFGAALMCLVTAGRDKSAWFEHLVLRQRMYINVLERYIRKLEFYTRELERGVSDHA